MGENIIKNFLEYNYNKLTEQNKIIYKIARQHNFYSEDILLRLSESQKSNKVEIIPIEHPIPDDINNNCYLIYKENNTIIIGFSILIHYEEYLDLNYLFIIPECRNQTLGTETIKFIKKEYKGKPIGIPTKEKKLISIINKLDFKFQRMCHNKKDLWFRCENK
tara:strand:- start:1118 stop:1606 length:489 start_codon:yes stop_codon:yes gene_type:complete